MIRLSSPLSNHSSQPDNPDAYTNLGSIYKDLGNLDQAYASTLKSLELKPNNPNALINLGNIYEDLGMLDQALTSTLKSLELKPNNHTALFNLGRAYEISNKLDSALKSYEQSANLIMQNKNQSSFSSLINTSIILLQLNRIEDAETALSKALDIGYDKGMSLKTSSIKNRKNDNAYLSYLNKLIPEIPRIDSSVESQILHIGESHCLTFTNQTIVLKGKNVLSNLL